jgi:hypothetical protein
MPRRRSSVAAALLLAAYLAPAAAFAQSAADAPAPDTGESRIGVIAAVGCGIFTRAAFLVPHPITIAGAIACCAFTFLDGLGDPDTPAGGR